MSRISCPSFLQVFSLRRAVEISSSHVLTSALSGNFHPLALVFHFLQMLPHHRPEGPVRRELPMPLARSHDRRPTHHSIPCLIRCVIFRVRIDIFRIMLIMWNSWESPDGVFTTFDKVKQRDPCISLKMSSQLVPARAALIIRS